jgi:hypothetical protein
LGAKPPVTKEISKIEDAGYKGITFYVDRQV